MVVSFCLFVYLFAAAGAFRVDPCLLLCLLVIYYCRRLQQVNLRRNDDVSFFAGVR